MVGTKKLDRIHGTSKSAIESLNDFDSTRAQHLSNAKNLEELLEITTDVDSGHSWFGDWKVLENKFKTITRHLQPTPNVSADTKTASE